MNKAANAGPPTAGANSPSPAAMLGGIVTPAVAGIIADYAGLSAIPYFLLGVVVINGILIVACLSMPPWKAAREG